VRLEVARLPGRGHGPEGGPKPHLRFDRVVVRVLHDVQTRLRPVVPPGVALVFTLTAPIRLASKTTSAIEATARRLLTASAGPDEVRRTVHGNRIRVRRENVGTSPASAVIGFVHNRETRPRALINVTRALLRVIWARPLRRPSKRSRDRWLVLLSEDATYLEAYRSAYRQLDRPAGLMRVLLVCDDGDVESLT
jgi:hypothetical protein